MYNESIIYLNYPVVVIPNHALQCHFGGESVFHFPSGNARELSLPTASRNPSEKSGTSAVGLNLTAASAEAVGNFPHLGGSDGVE